MASNLSQKGVMPDPARSLFENEEGLSELPGWRRGIHIDQGLYVGPGLRWQVIPRQPVGIVLAKQLTIGHLQSVSWKCET